MKNTKNMKKWMAGVLLMTTLGCSAPLGAAETVLTVDRNKSYQTIESFGASGAWWSQYVGGWDDAYKDEGISAREKIAQLLYDREKGIGLTCYRYNMGAGSADSGKGDYSDPHRRAQNFEIAPGEYDWDKDQNAVWMMQQAVKNGAEEIVLFFNSPIERLTKNGMAHLTKGTKSNIAPEHYAAFAVYACDVAEHFIDLGLPIRFLSPINEPQWEWVGGQEGCHYEPTEIANVYIAFLKEMQSREKLTGVELSGPESGEWGGKTTQYVSALLGNQTLAPHFTTVDCHSYWSNTQSKVSFRNWMNLQYPDVKIRMSEWCEMVNGSDYTMDSAIHLAQTLAEDLTILNAVSWQTWVAVAPGGYRDGLIYVTETNHAMVPLKRLWAFGNYTRYIRPGFTRVDIAGGEEYSAVAFAGEEEGKKKLAVVLINDSAEAKPIRLTGDFGDFEGIVAYETSANYDLYKITERVSNTAFTLSPQSVTTILFSE